MPAHSVTHEKLPVMICLLNQFPRSKDAIGADECICSEWCASLPTNLNSNFQRIIVPAIDFLPLRLTYVERFFVCTSKSYNQPIERTQSNIACARI